MKKAKFKKNILKIVIVLIFIIFVIVSSWLIFYRSKIFVNQTRSNIKIITEKFKETFGAVKESVEEFIEIKPKQLVMPDKVKGIYMTGYTFLNENSRNRLIKLVEETELNTLIIDIQDPGGRFTFEPQSEFLQQIEKNSKALSQENYAQILDELQQKEIYSVARVITFQDSRLASRFPELALKNTSGGIWKNWGGLSWLDMTNQEVWETVVLKALEAEKLGFDEIQFDYIRFPSDGNVSTISYTNFPANKTKAEILKEFYVYLSSELSDLKIPLSIDLFGLTYNKWKSENYDLGIGQKLVDAALYFDVICPMVYPSHYPQGHLNFANPALYPYQVIDDALQDGKYLLNNLASTTQTEIKTKTRPWLQDFDLGADYNDSLIQAEIQACDDNQASGWSLWNALNNYTVEALKVTE